jgi:hypothetical protein
MEGHVTTHPRIARVHITISENGAVQAGVFRSLADADAMLARAYAIEPAPEGRPFHLLLPAVIWTDGFELRPRIYVSAQLVRDSDADGGILRHALLRAARAQASPATYRGFPLELVQQYVAEGRALLARLEADTARDEAHRNARTPTKPFPSLLPDPAAAVGRLRDRFSRRRALIRPIGDETDQAVQYPGTNHADVRYVVNYVSLALQSDVATLEPVAGALVWNHWHAVRETIETLLRFGDDTDEYKDNEGLWTRQLPALARLLDDASIGVRGLRNADLHFRPVGRRGEPYPSWVVDLRRRSGAYAIRVPGVDGAPTIAYVGSSSADRLYETLTRHFQLWRRWQGHGRGYGEGRDPGLTYERDTSEAAVILTPAKDALDLEMSLIESLRPRDNLIGKPDTDAWTWYFEGTPQHGESDETPF